MNKKISFSSLKDINTLTKGKKIVLFGAGNIAEKTLRIIDKKKFLDFYSFHQKYPKYTLLSF